jgi:hypothetical protein
MTPDKIKQLAEALTDERIAAGMWDEQIRGDHISDLTASLTAVWPKVFAPPEGAVKVRVAVGVMPAKGLEGLIVQACGIDAADDECGAIQEICGGADTHRGIIEAWLPPVPPVPVVQAEAEGV